MYLFRYVLCIATKKHGRERIKIRGRAFYYNAYIYYTTLLSIVNYFGATFFLFFVAFYPFISNLIAVCDSNKKPRTVVLGFGGGGGS